jgi:hypothetical protein
MEAYRAQRDAAYGAMRESPLAAATLAYRAQLDAASALQFGAMRESPLVSLDAMRESPLVSLDAAYASQFGTLGAMPRMSVGLLTNTYLSQINEALQVIADGIKARDTGEESNSSAEVKTKQRLDNREFAAWLTIIAFLIIYISYVAAIEHNSHVAEISVTDGPAPFDAAMAVGALVFWAWMNHSGGSSDK